MLKRCLPLAALLLTALLPAQQNNAAPPFGKKFDVELPDKGGTITMIWCPKGTFTMGSPADESGRCEDEKTHTVTLTGFWIAETETTQVQWKSIKGTDQTQLLKRTNRFGELAGTGDAYPIYHVSLWDAVDFCKRLTDRERAAGRLPNGYVYRLPTEAQWEYACRAGTTTALNNGKDLSDKLNCPVLSEVGWFRGNVGSTEAIGTQPVAKKKPNAWGLYDMHGNVAEWCLDKCDFDYDSGLVITNTYRDNVSNPFNPTGIDAVYRGGAWIFPATMCRSASRRCQNPKTRSSHVGFRITLAPGK